MVQNFKIALITIGFIVGSFKDFGNLEKDSNSFRFARVKETRRNCWLLPLFFIELFLSWLSCTDMGIDKRDNHPNELLNYKLYCFSQNDFDCRCFL